MREIKTLGFTLAEMPTNIWIYQVYSSVRFFAALQNTDGTRAEFLRPLGGLHSFFQRYRAIVGGQNGSGHY